MTEIISIGIDRGFGIARSLYEEATSKKKNYQFDYQFSRAGRLTRKLSKKSPESHLIDLLLEAHDAGAVCLQWDFVKEKWKKAKISWNEEHLFQLLAKNPKIVFENGNFYFSNFYHTEISFCSKINQLFRLPDSTKVIPTFPKELALSEEQKKAIENSLQNSFSIITGGPGTGKTTILRALLHNLEKEYSPKKIQVVTPTGKAAKRVKESASELFDNKFPEPSTIHKLISFNPVSGKAYFNSENPLDIEVLILDEASMADIFILNLLLEAFSVTEKKKFILVGDPDQLLSVNSGAVFSDLVALNKNVVKLTHSYRQSQEAETIRTIAKETNLGKSKEIWKFPKTNLEKIEFGFQMLVEEDTEKILTQLEMWQDFYKDKNFQILTPFNEGTLGIQGINQFFLDKTEKTSYPAIVTRNLSEISLFNGETGILLEKESELEFQIDKETYKIPYYLKDAFLPAYAITIHKSQGSEYDHVCIVIPPPSERAKRASEIFTRRLLYTAITRAKKTLTILGSLPSLEATISNQGFPRYSGIKDRISGIF